MKKHALSAIVAASILAAASSALAQQAPDTFLTQSLDAIVTEFGNSAGQMTISDPTGGTQIFARGGRRFVVYTAGDNVYASDSFAFCAQDPTGGFSYCDVVEPPSTGYYCPLGTCSCGNFMDCLWLTMSGDCDTPIGNCNSPSGCTCENWGP